MPHEPARRPCPRRRAAAPPAADFRARLPEDEVIYFLLPDRFENGDPANDRGGLTGGPLQTGFDPTHKGFYHGGDLKGLIRRLDYLQGMGVTAIWLAPVFKNKPVQGGQGPGKRGLSRLLGDRFHPVDPHFGTNADFKAFVDAAHARGMKVYMDIITNHTADVIQFAECEAANACPYRSIADYPYQRRGGTGGAAINPGFLGETRPDAENFAELTDPNFAYTLNVRAGGEERQGAGLAQRSPALSQSRRHARSAAKARHMGDFVGLDDLMTEHPRVVAGMIDIYGSWIDRFGIDGFRIDTARHVNPEFWQEFVPAMLARARARGIPNFHIFGEVANDDFSPGFLAMHTVEDKLPAVLDFAFKQAALRSLAQRAADRDLARVPQSGRALRRRRGHARGNCRPSSAITTWAASPSMSAKGNKAATPDELLAARQARPRADVHLARRADDLFRRRAGLRRRRRRPGRARGHVPSRSPRSTIDNQLLGTDARPTRSSNFDTAHPLYRADRRACAHPHRHARRCAGAIAAARGRGQARACSRVSRFDAADRPQRSASSLFNTSAQPVTPQCRGRRRHQRPSPRWPGTCPAAPVAPGSCPRHLARVRPCRSARAGR